MKKIDLIMLSRLGLGDGGRETWLNNFLKHIYEEDIKVKFNLITLDMNDDNLLLGNNKKLIDSHHKYIHKIKKLPISIGFIIHCMKALIFEKKNSDDVLAVGGLNEALVTLLGYFFRGVKGNKILWLRTIYTKEKGYALNKITQNIVLKIEIFLIKNFFDIIIANGDDTAEFYRDLGVNCIVIKNAIDLERWNKLKKPEYSDTLKIAFIGRLSEVKGIKAFLSAIEVLDKNNNMNGIEFHVVGDGPYIEEVKRYEEMGIVKSYGSVSNIEIPKILQEMHCCVALTYLTDFLGGGGVSNALIEQMAAGKMIVCWDNNIFRKVLNEENAYFVQQDNSISLAETFLDIKSNISLANEKSNKVRVLSQNYSITNHVEKFFDVIGIE